MLSMWPSAMPAQAANHLWRYEQRHLCGCRTSTCLIQSRWAMSNRRLRIKYLDWVSWANQINDWCQMVENRFCNFPPFMSSLENNPKKSKKPPTWLDFPFHPWPAPAPRRNALATAPSAPGPPHLPTMCRMNSSRCTIFRKKQMQRRTKEHLSTSEQHLHSSSQLMALVVKHAKVPEAHLHEAR